MHGLEEFSGAKKIDDGRPWYADMTRYHWFVLIVAALGWLFDCLDQQLFILARQPAMRELLVLADSRESALKVIRESGNETFDEAQLDAAILDIKQTKNAESSA